MGIMKPGHVGTPETPTTGEGVGLVGFWEALELDVPLGVLGSMVIGSMGYFTYL